MRRTLTPNAGSLSFVCVITLLMLCGNTTAQDLEQKVSDYFQLQTVYRQEKLYLHLDKPYYAAGERIYWKGYLVDAIFHTPETKSNFIYVELIDNADKVISRYKARREDGSFHGSILLSPEIPAGEYYLRAYTQWMLNAGADYFYHHRFRIGNALDMSIQSTIHYEDSPEEGSSTAVIRFVDESNKPLTDIKVQSWLTASQKRMKRYSRRTDARGEIRFDIPEVNKGGGERTLDVSFVDAPYNYGKTFYIPLLGKEKNEFALSFFPEGGDLLDGCRQRVAFKAQRTDGVSCRLHGFVLEEAGDTLVSFRTEHEGMGDFTFLASAGKKYRVTASLDSVVYRDFALPEIKAQGRQLSVIQRKGIVQYDVVKSYNTEWNDTDTLFLVGHTRGKLSIFSPLTPERASGRFRNTDLPEGITELLLVDRGGVVLSRRLVFVVPEELADMNMEPFSEYPERRQLVEIPLHFTDKQGNPIQGNFSVSLTDRKIVAPDSLTDNIRSSILLTSDLKGYVENPGYYLSEGDARTEYNTELLMLTHGWTRFCHDNLSELPKINIDYFIEGGQTISGKAITRLGAKAKGFPISLLAPSQGVSSATQTDNEGNFIFEGIEFCDTLTFAAQGRSQRGYAAAYLKIDSVPYIQPNNPFPICPEGDRNFQEYDNTVREAYLSEGGMRVIRLNEVTITAKKKDQDDYVSAYGGLADYRITSDKIESMGGTTAYDVLTRSPGIWKFGDNFLLVGERISPLFIINQMRYEGEDVMMALRSVDAGEIKSIEIVKSVSALFLGQQAAGGAVLITLKDVSELPAKASPGLAVFTMQGYSKSVEFYHPVYETPEQKASDKTDIRSTVYWEPDLKTDADGKAVIRFYTPDNLIKPHLIVEGVTPSGYLMRFEK